MLRCFRIFFHCISMLFTLIFASDSANSEKAKEAHFDDDTCMEIFVQALSNESRDVFKDGRGEYLPGCDWDGLTCNEDGRIISINTPQGLTGSLCLAYLPEHLEYFKVYKPPKEIKGVLEAEKLPKKLKVFHLRGKSFTGGVAMHRLPSQLTEFSISSNRFEGSCCFHKLPKGMVSLWVNSNQFSGSVWLTHLPKTMQQLNLSRNRFEGTLNLDHLPATRRGK